MAVICQDNDHLLCVGDKDRGTRGTGDLHTIQDQSHDLIFLGVHDHLSIFKAAAQPIGAGSADRDRAAGNLHPVAACVGAAAFKGDGYLISSIPGVILSQLVGIRQDDLGGLCGFHLGDLTIDCGSGRGRLNAIRSGGRLGDSGK